MIVSVIVNGHAGFANFDLIESIVKRALFRCDLTFLAPNTIEDLNHVIASESERADVLMICGGDGTLNAAIQPLMRARERLKKLPDICPVPVGTANDLARELGISNRIDRAVRLVLDGEIRKVDLLQIESIVSGEKREPRFMLTNGGIGVTAETADSVNVIRNLINDAAESPTTDRRYLPVVRLAKAVVKRAGSHVYELALAACLARWEKEKWHVEIAFTSGETFTTQSPFIMISNQKGLGGNYMTAPLTLNDDGLFNLMLLDSLSFVKQARSLWKIRMGLIPDPTECPRYEIESCRLRALEGAKRLTFFGDGEILARDADEITITCLKSELSVFVRKPTLPRHGSDS